MVQPRARAVAIASLLVLTALALLFGVGSPATATTHLGPAVPSSAHPTPGTGGGALRNVAASPAARPTAVRPTLAPGVTEITPSGTVTNASAPISVSGNTYTLTSGFTGALLIERNGSIINGAGKNLNALSGNGNTIEVFGAQSVTVENFNITNGTYAVYADAVSGLTLTGNTVQATYIAIEVDLSGNLTITNNVARGSQGALYLYYDAAVVVSGNSFQGSTSYGIYPEFVQQLLAQNNNLSGSYDGFEAYSLTTATISSNTIQNSRYAVYVDQASDLVISLNNVSGSEYGIYLEYTNNIRGTYDEGSGGGSGYVGLETYFSTNTVFSHLRFIGYIDEGVYLEYSTNGSVTSSTLSNDDYGFYTYETSQVICTGNNLSLSYYGVYVEYGAHYLISNNSITSTGSSGATAIESYEIAQISVQNNSAPGFAFGFYDEYSSQLTVRNNDLAHEHYDDYGIYLYEENSVWVLNNNVYNASGYGIYAEYVGSLVVSGNSVSYAGNEGIYVYESQFGEVVGNTVDHANNYSLDIEYCVDFTVSNNVADDTLASFGTALYLYYNTNVAAMNNTLSRTNYSIYAEGDVGDQITGNNASFAHEGIFLGYLANVTVAGNEFWTDHWSFDLTDSANVLIYHNNFVGDAGWIISGGVSANIRWDNGYPSGGNFWSNWTSPDAQGGPGQNVPGADGIVDHPFVVNTTFSDHYPLAAPWVVHTITFTESGLPAGTAWQVTVNGAIFASTGASIGYPEPDGATSTYSYSVARVNGYLAPTPASGSGTMSRTDVSVDVTFAPYTYTVTVTETGLKTGSSWSVTLGGKTLSGSAASITFSEPNGTYAYSALPVAGYISPNANGSVPVSSAGATVQVSYVALQQGSGASTGASPTGYSATLVYALVGLIVVLGVLAALGFLLGRRRAPPAPTTPWMPPPSGSSAPPAAGGSPAPPPGATGGSPPPPPGPA
jgi:nitrous oxidase accessory protein NosD